MKKIVITRKINPTMIQKLEKDFRVVLWDEAEKPMPRDRFLEETADAHGVLTMLSDKVDEEMLSNARNLKVVANLAVGYDNIDLESAKQHNVIITNTPDVLTETTAELAFTLMLTAARRVLEANRQLMAGEWSGWSPYHMAGTDIFGKTVGIFGMGSIGAAFARRLSGFRTKVLYHNRSQSELGETLGAEYVSFEDLLSASDFVLCAAPLTDETKHRFDKEAFQRMKDSAFFINIGRGAHVVEADLARAVETGQIRGAALDVFENEPIGKDHPFVNMDNMTLLPHIGSASVDTRNNMMNLCVNNIMEVLNGGNPITPVK
ncbi:D-glycerate dehydrogenase [Salinicoccus sp. ID82-1]|uniref:D-lactate dehydrogenase n=1 Tax=Salinicoccus cyprini TaxID=2493691 RepID=A0A558AWU9_9STAP|nr:MULTISPECIES: D-glycerate dehydrogenase [Salinicoccus]MCG1010101.1 D-glycerate dehydrogenase [Salinicoccus sp. ID82-1]TVT28737.1 D-glycerate dehydrogenase [Salinicoccus cyprini]